MTALCGWLRRSCCGRSQQAPLDWIMELNRRPLAISFTVVAVVALGFIVSFTSTGVAGPPTMVFLATDFVVCAGTALVLIKRYLPSNSIEMAIVMGAWLSVISLGLAVVIFSTDYAFRLRVHATTVIFKTIPAIFGFPLLHTAVYSFGTLLVETAAWEISARRHRDPTPPNLHASNVVFSIGWLAAAWMTCGRLFGIYDAQRALAAEKVLMESIISMMCDATIWLSKDGSTILRSDQRLQMILGGDAHGRAIGDSLPEEEQQRLRDSLSRATAEPVLMPTTLRTQEGVHIPVDMFIVGNRDVSKSVGQEPAPAFLIGVRIASRQGTEALGNAEMRTEAASLLASRGREEQAAPCPEDLQSALSSMPETTATGRIFERVDIDRWLEDSSSEDRQGELRQRLEKVVALGQSERWLMSSRELTIAADTVLGAGSFGVVCGGWLHGSPIAVKTTRRAADSASVKHLVAIANEIRILRHVRHPNVVLFHGACVESARGEVMLVLERVKGPNLYHYVVEHSSDSEIYLRFQLLLDVACALRYLHAQSPKIVHGDLKDSNILVEHGAARAKLVDFGLSRLLTKGVRPLGGTLSWMAPELISGPTVRPQPSADVFSFGRVAYLIVACRKPLEGVRTEVIEEMAKTGAVPALLWQDDRPLHFECNGLCQRMLNPRPEQRPSMAEVHQAASGWRLQGQESQMPALELSLAEVGDGAARAAGVAGAMRSLRDAVGAALLPQGPRAAQEVANPGTAAPAAGRRGAAAEPAAGALGELALPWRSPTKDGTTKLLVLGAMMQSNFRVPPGSCCKYHAATAELRDVVLQLGEVNCQPQFGPHEQFQCSVCGVLDIQTQRGCAICSRSASCTRSLAIVREEAEHVTCSL